MRIMNYGETYRKSGGHHWKNTPWNIARVELIRSLLGSRRTGLMLDVGCGDAWVSYNVADLVFPVGIDPSVEGISSAKKHGYKYPLIVADAINIPFRGDVFDKVLCSEVIEHVIDDEQLLKEINEVLKMQGIVIITTPKKHSIDELVFGKCEFHIKEYDEREITQLILKYYHILNIEYLDITKTILYLMYHYFPINSRIYNVINNIIKNKPFFIRNFLIMARKD